MTQKEKMDKKEQHRVLVRDLNPVITCRLCDGYFIDATTLVDCLHVFCRACILRHFENSKTGCPTCNTMYKKKSQACFRPDPQIQSLVYKLVPGLYGKEMQRREEFYRSPGVRASSSCSDDSIIDRERDMINDQDEVIPSYVADKAQFFGPEDSISLSLEYYQVHLDTTDLEERSKSPQTKPSDGDDAQTKPKTDLTNGNSDGDCTAGKEAICNSDKEDKSAGRECDKRFLQCPPAVSMKHLQKFIRMKFGLTSDHRVDIIYKGEVLPVNFSLMDVAYTFKWTRTKPMRFFYRIFTPMKVRPIKIVNTTLSTGGRQLQIVPVKPNPEPGNALEELKQEPKTEPEVENPERSLEESEDQKNDKERLFAHLQLQSRVQADKDKKIVPDKPLIKDCVQEYEEPDQEEIKRFAEKRDREWALQKKLDDETRRDEEYVGHHFSRKRKKNKHSKSEFNIHKKRKLHAEIASNEEDLKLKVKITNNGHKHKHHKSSGQVNEKTQTSDVSSKEKLLQMRQIRHKHVSSEDKNVQTISNVKLSKDSSTSTEKVKLEATNKHRTEEKQIEVKELVEEPRTSPKLKEDIAKLKIKVTEPSSSVSESAVLPKQQTEGVSTSPKVGTFLEPTSSKPGFAFKNSVEKEFQKKLPTVQLERNEQTEKQAQKTFLKTFQSYAEKYQRNEKLQQNKLENTKAKLNTITLNKEKLTHTKLENKITTNNKSLERKIANLQQHCTIEAKPQEKIEKKITLTNDKPKMVTPHYPAGFTVSKIEQGVKRKAEDNDSLQDKRPSLEITLINPPTSNPIQQPTKLTEKPPVKRPPPATIPLDRIKKSVNLKSGISIIPKLPEKCDNVAPLDLSKSSKSPDNSPKASPKLDVPNGFSLVNRQVARPPTATGTEKNNMALSNLQMLSKVATEHSTLNNKPPQQNNVLLNKPRPQMPSLQTIKSPTQNPGQAKTPNLQNLPKLNEIQKYRPTNPQIRNLRPNQNQNIRNIPNPSLFIIQQNKNRQSQMANMQQNSNDSTKTTTTVTTNSTTTTTSKETGTVTPVKAVVESKLQEKKEISV